MATNDSEVLVSETLHPELLQVVCESSALHLYQVGVLLFECEGCVFNLHAKVEV
jgi:hypothetical protein